MATDSSLTEQTTKPIILQMNLRKQLLFYLEKRDLTASYVARKASVPKQTISRWLSGQKPKDISQVKKVADVLCVSVDHLCFGDGEEAKLEKVSDLGSLLGDDWLGGIFELRIRRVPKAGGSKL